MFVLKVKSFRDETKSCKIQKKLITLIKGEGRGRGGK
jgi:hypothetical protein